MPAPRTRLTDATAVRCGTTACRSGTGRNFSSAGGLPALNQDVMRGVIGKDFDGVAGVRFVVVGDRKRNGDRRAGSRHAGAYDARSPQLAVDAVDEPEIPVLRGVHASLAHRRQQRRLREGRCAPWRGNGDVGAAAVHDNGLACASVNVANGRIASGFVYRPVGPHHGLLSGAGQVESRLDPTTARLRVAEGIESCILRRFPGRDESTRAQGLVA